jgi:DNA-binding MarR family transcriptional regulator
VRKAGMLADPPRASAGGGIRGRYGHGSVSSRVRGTTYRVAISLPDMSLSQSDFKHLLELRTGLRHFLRWSEQQAQAVGLTPAQHQLLLAIRGHGDPAGPNVGEVANYLVLRHHSAVGLIDRAVAAGLVNRSRDPANNSAVRLKLTKAGIRKLDALAETHLEELTQLAPTMRSLWRAIEHGSSNTELARSAKVSRAMPRPR